jgi:hypothetical protein
MKKESMKAMLSFMKDNFSKKASVHTFKVSFLIEKIKQALFQASRKFKSTLRFQDSTRKIESTCLQVKTEINHSQFNELMLSSFTDEVLRKYTSLENGYLPDPRKKTTYRLLTRKEIIFLFTNRSGTMQRIEN